MPGLPDPYTPAYDFKARSERHPTEPLPGNRLQIELQALAIFAGQVDAFLRQTYNAEGKIPNGYITRHMLQEVLVTQLNVKDRALVENTVASVTTLRDAIIALHQEVLDARSGATARASAATSAAQQAANHLAATSLAAEEVSSRADATAASVTEAENWAAWSEYWSKLATLSEEQAYKWAEYLAGPVEVAAPEDPDYPNAVDDGYWSAKWWALKAQEYATGWTIENEGAPVGVGLQVLNFTGTAIEATDNDPKVDIRVDHQPVTSAGGKVDLVQSVAIPGDGTITLRTIESSDASVLITQNADTVDFQFPGATGEANLGANVGLGTPVFRDKTGLVLNFRSLKSTDASLSIATDGDEIDITGAGNVVGPGSSKANNLPVFANADGDLLDDSGIAVSDLALLSAQNTFLQTQVIAPSTGSGTLAIMGPDGANIVLRPVVSGTVDQRDFRFRAASGNLAITALTDAGAFVRDLLTFSHAGGALLDNAAGGVKGEGTLNAKGYYLNGVPLDFSSRWFTLANAPSNTDDQDAGYAQGDRAYCAETEAVHTCVDASSGAAVWVQDGMSGDDYGHIPHGYVTPLRNIRIRYNHGGGAGIIQLTGDPGQDGRVLVKRRSGQGGPARRWIAVSGTFSLNDAAPAGPGGIDTGSWADDVWYDLYMVGGASGTDLVASLQGDAAFEPAWGNLAGYDRWFSRVGYALRSAGAFVRVEQHDGVCTRTQILLGSGTLATPALYAFPQGAPPCARARIAFEGHVSQGILGRAYLKPDDSVGADPLTSQRVVAFASGSSTGDVHLEEVEVPVSDPSVRQVYAWGTSLGSGTQMHVVGWRLGEHG